jgi:hypothetical protein
MTQGQLSIKRQLHQWKRATVIARDFHVREPVSVFTQRLLINSANSISVRGGTAVMCATDLGRSFAQFMVPLICHGEVKALNRCIYIVE